MKALGINGSARKTILLIVSAVIIYAMSGGIRANFGNIITPLSEVTGMSYSNFSFVMGVAQLVYGISQPLWGVLALKKSNTFALMCGIPLMLIGIIVSPFTESLLIQTLTFGIMLGAGTGALSFGLIMGAISPIIGEKRAAAVSGILNAGCGIGISLMSPLIQRMNDSAGITKTMLALAIPFFILVPVVLWIGRLGKQNPPTIVRDDRGIDESIATVLGNAVKSQDYRLLMAGFFTCGFHMVILQTHMVSQFISYGIPDSSAAVIYTAYGIATMLGALISGYLCSKLHLKNVLGSLYGIRAVAVAVFIFIMPKSMVGIIAFALIMGLTGDATVTPTAQIVNLRFGAAKMGFLFGMIFVCHQLGGFLSSWLGGILIGNGKVDLLWAIDAILCTAAAFASFRIPIHSGE